MEGMTGARSDTLAAAIGALGPSLEGPSPAQVAGALAIVIGSIVLVAWLYRRMTGGRIVGGRGSEISVVGRAQVDKRSSILLIEVDGRRILVGATPTSLSPLSEWEQIAEPDMAIEEARAPVSLRFENVLGRVITKLRALEEAPS